MELPKDSHKIFTIEPGEFESFALEVFRLQYAGNPVYRGFVDALSINAEEIRSVAQIPFLPIRFFKSHTVVTGLFEPNTVFESSGTTGSINSHHYIRDLNLYEQSFIRGFELFYGPVKDWCILGLLPSYLERKNSSLVYMTDQLIRLSDHAQSGFFLQDFDKLSIVLKKNQEQNQKTLLLGVTFALLDFAEKYSKQKNHQSLKNSIIMETGGMKGRREEMIRQEVHEILQQSFGVSQIHSEYGMTELLSQAYSGGNGIFKCPPWMKVLVRDDEDPFSVSSGQLSSQQSAKTGIINIIDLANIHSCSFIATDDAGKLYPDGSFEVLGRVDNSDLRGCSLLVV